MPLKTPLYTARDMRNQLLCDKTLQVIKYKVNRACGDWPANPAMDEKNMDDIWRAVIPMIQALSDIEVYGARNAKDVLDLLAKGDISIDDSIKLMHVMKGEQELSELPKLIELMQGLTNEQSSIN